MDSFFLFLSGHRTPITIGWLVLLLLWESGMPFFSFFRRRGKDRLKHAARNFLVGAPSLLLPAIGYMGLLAALCSWTEENDFGLLNILPLGTFGHALGAVLFLDVFTYFWHRANHRIPFLWRFHRVHHADPEMDVTTANRFHIGEIAMSSILRIPLLALTGIHLWELAVFETLMLLVVQFHHANIGIGSQLDRALRCILVTPAMHKVHHSRIRRETDSNFTALLSIWDRIFRTFRLRPDLEKIDFGLDEFDDPEHRTLVGLYRMPLINLPTRPKKKSGS